jgi:adenosine deaminase
VLRTEADFYDLTWAYFQRAAADRVRHSEIFFDPQTHTERGIGFPVFMGAFARARADAEAKLGITSGLIMCFLRHLPGAAALETLEQARPFYGDLVAVGLDSGERGNPPQRFAEAFARARQAGLRAVAHAGEEGPPEYIRDSLDLLGAERIDHGVACEQDDALVERLAAEAIPLTVCPLSNEKLRVFPDLHHHNLRRLLRRGVRITINSDDPAYFGGYIGDNYLAAQQALGLDREDLARIARNAVEGAFVSQDRRRQLLAELDASGEPGDWLPLDPLRDGKAAARQHRRRQIDGSHVSQQPVGGEAGPGRPDRSRGAVLSGAMAPADEADGPQPGEERSVIIPRSPRNLMRTSKRPGCRCGPKTSSTRATSSTMRSPRKVSSPERRALVAEMRAALVAWDRGPRLGAL